MANNRSTHCISLSADQEKKLDRVQKKYPKISLPQMLMATVDSLDVEEPALVNTSASVTALALSEED